MTVIPGISRTIPRFRTPAGRVFGELFSMGVKMRKVPDPAEQKDVMQLFIEGPRRGDLLRIHGQTVRVPLRLDGKIDTDRLEVELELAEERLRGSWAADVVDFESGVAVGPFIRG